MSEEQNYTVILSAIIAEMRLTKEINIKLKESLRECQSKPLALNSAIVPKCDLGYQHQEVPCLKDQNEDPSWKASLDAGYCCEVLCPNHGEVHYRLKDEIPADVDFNSQCSEVSIGGFCCDLL